ncbi:CHAP domain-containing protein [Pedococcus bigeumensis]|uniref:CHAP domain-containing protein n=1 Tax=Pedococcus bigeumensis TaxID=433644 RepID=UPI002FEAC8D2
MRTPNLSQKPVRVALAAALGLSAVAGGAAIADAATGTVRTSGATLTVRSGPGTGYTAVATIAKGTKVNISCQTYGSTVKGTYGTSSIWDKIGTGRYVSDAYVYTGRDGFVAPRCGGSTPAPTGAIKDDYPYRGATSGVDPWNFYKGQCTSFAAWRVRHNVGVAFSNSYKGQHWGNAEHWDNAARAAGIPVHQSPKVGDIAVRSSGTYGHVAYVAKVNSDGSFMVEEYNHVRSDTYSYRRATRGTGSEQFSDFIRFT